MKVERKRAAECAASVFSGNDGKVFLAYLEEFCHYRNMEFVEDSRRSEYVNGRRSVMNEINSLLKGES